MISLTEENYLKAIYKLLEAAPDEAVNTNAISDLVKTKAASVTDMLKKLAKKKLINYQKYQGVTLTKKGTKEAVYIIRKHRLWEVFLVEKLNFKWDEVHNIAEQLEHIHSYELVEKLDKFLGWPKVDPHGDPIPDVTGKFAPTDTRLLSTLQKGDSCVLSGVVDHSPAFLQYLDSVDLGLGERITVKDVISYDKSIEVISGKKKSLFVSNDVAKNILVNVKK